jgi:hypothetical protein
MTRGKDTFSTQLNVVLDPRAKFSLEDRRQEFAAAMRVYTLLGDMSFDVDRVNSIHDALLARAAALKGDPALAKRLNDTAQKVEALRGKIVATKEGGAITGEERIREKTTGLYGAILNYEGRPGDYQIARIDSLKKDLDDVRTEFESLLAKDLSAINKSLKQKKLPSVEPISRTAWDATNSESDTGAVVTPSVSRWERD